MLVRTNPPVPNDGSRSPAPAIARVDQHTDSAKAATTMRARNGVREIRFDFVAVSGMCGPPCPEAL